jgi:hypothetical protein
MRRAPSPWLAIESPIPYDPIEYDDAEEAVRIAEVWADYVHADLRELALHLAERHQECVCRRPHEACGMLAHYVRVEYDFSAGVVDELLRIGRSLLELPSIDGGFTKGKLSWHQIVALTRVAVPRHEAAWLRRALALSLEELERVVARSARGWAPPESADDTAAERVSAAVGGTDRDSSPTMFRRGGRPWRWARDLSFRRITARRRARGRGRGSWNAPDVRRSFRAPPPSG